MCIRDRTKITNISNDDLKDKGSFSSHLQELTQFFLGETQLVAHNVAFDVKILGIELRRLGMITKFPWPSKQICTAVISERLHGKRLKLVNFYEELFGEKFDHAHRAMADVEALTKITRNLIQKGEI